jgi:hypothetical protein
MYGEQVMTLGPTCLVSLALSMTSLIFLPQTVADTHVFYSSDYVPVLAADHHPDAMDDDKDYSLLMHHTSGWAVLALSALISTDRLTGQRYRTVRIGIGGVWLLLGAFLFILADPEGWPIGPFGFVESFTMPTSGEWLQHKILSFIPALFGLYVILGRGPSNVPNRWNYGLAFAAVFGAIGLLSHQHISHPGMDVVNLQHRLFALTALLIAVSLVQEMWSGKWKGKAVYYPIGLLLLGLQLTFYTE